MHGVCTAFMSIGIRRGLNRHFACIVNRHILETIVWKNIINIYYLTWEKAKITAGI
jgi:hypothetical protein